MKTLLGLALAIVVLFPACLSATPAKPALEVVVLGSGGPRAFGRAGSSYILLVDGTPRILLDAGPGAFLRIGELDLNLEKVDTVLLTHLHIDHSGDLSASSTPERLLAMDQSRIASLVQTRARTGQDYSPRLRDLPICWWEPAAPSPIKRPSARANHLPFATWQLAWIHGARRLWMTMA